MEIATIHTVTGVVLNMIVASATDPELPGTRHVAIQGRPIEHLWMHVDGSFVPPSRYAVVGSDTKVETVIRRIATDPPPSVIPPRIIVPVVTPSMVVRPGWSYTVGGGFVPPTPIDR